MDAPYLLKHRILTEGYILATVNERNRSVDHRRVPNPEARRVAAMRLHGIRDSTVPGSTPCDFDSPGRVRVWGLRGSGRRG